ncbi:MAG: cytidylate kinase-like family protein [Eubacteriales bacterium]|nr:cytidylate kinase-like family protein [Eubacteriales bacterium]
MNNETIITIGRQFGSGGKEIGEKLAEALGIKCYDKELLSRASKESGISQELFENHDEKPTNSFLYSLVMDTYSMGYSSATFNDMPLNHKVFLAQFNAIKKIADEGPCVIVGRCADYALAEYKNCISVFIHASMDNRIKRISEKYQLSENKAKDLIVKTDKKRANYYNYYSSKKWGDASSYHLCIDSGICGIDGTVEMIQEFVKLKEKQRAKR